MKRVEFLKSLVALPMAGKIIYDAARNIVVDDALSSSIPQDALVGFYGDNTPILFVETGNYTVNIYHEVREVTHRDTFGYSTAREPGALKHSIECSKLIVNENQIGNNELWEYVANYNKIKFVLPYPRHLEGWSPERKICMDGYISSLEYYLADSDQVRANCVIEGIGGIYIYTKSGSIDKGDEKPISLPSNRIKYLS